MTKPTLRRRLRPNWWVIGPFLFNFALWAVIVWGANALYERANRPGDVMIADLLPDEQAQR